MYMTLQVGRKADRVGWQSNVGNTLTSDLWCQRCHSEYTALQKLTLHNVYSNTVGKQYIDIRFQSATLYLKLTTLKYFRINHGDQRVIFNLKSS